MSTSEQPRELTEAEQVADFQESLKRAGTEPFTYEITARLAAFLLRVRNKCNRKLQRSYVEMYKEDIRHHRWQPNNATIGFDEYGNLKDGQHRLTAVAETEVTMRFIVVGGLPPESFATIDVGRCRTLSDDLTAEGENAKIASMLTAATRLDIYYDEETIGGPSRKLSKSEMLDHLRARPLLKQSGAWVTDMPMIGKSHAVWLHYRLGLVDPLLRDEFMSKLKAGAGLDEADPLFTLRDRLIKDADKKHSTPPIEKTAWVINVWNAIRNGKPVTSAAFRFGRGKKKFPRIV